MAKKPIVSYPAEAAPYFDRLRKYLSKHHGWKFRMRAHDDGGAYYEITPAKGSTLRVADLRDAARKTRTKQGKWCNVEAYSRTQLGIEAPDWLGSTYLYLEPGSKSARWELYC